MLNLGEQLDASISLGTMNSCVEVPTHSPWCGQVRVLQG